MQCKTCTQLCGAQHTFVTLTHCCWKEQNIRLFNIYVNFFDVLCQFVQCIRIVTCKSIESFHLPNSFVLGLFPKLLLFIFYFFLFSGGFFLCFMFFHLLIYFFTNNLQLRFLNKIISFFFPNLSKLVIHQLREDFRQERPLS